MDWYLPGCCLPTARLTAHHALFRHRAPAARRDAADPPPAAKSAPLQSRCAKRAGATVLARLRQRGEVRQALELGADFAANNRENDVAARAHEVTTAPGVDMVFDHVGPALWDAPFKAPKARVLSGQPRQHTGDQALRSPLLRLPVPHGHHPDPRQHDAGTARTEFAEAWSPLLHRWLPARRSTACTR